MKSGAGEVHMSPGMAYWSAIQPELVVEHNRVGVVVKKSLFHECHLTLDHAVMFGDNKGAIHIARNPIMEGRSKHIDIKYYFLRECVKRNDFLLDWVPTTQQLADLMTKNLTWQLFQENRLQLNLKPFKS